MTAAVTERYKNITQYTEEQLLKGCYKNKRKYQQQLYERYCDAMYTIAFRIVKDPDMAGDALQDSFIQVFRDIKKFRKESALGAWIKTIVVRTSIRKLKKEENFEPLEYHHTNGEVISWPDEMNGEDLEKAILSLPAGYRTVFLLVEVEGYKHKEVADMLEISEGTSKSQLYYAKKQLQKILRDFDER